MFKKIGLVPLICLVLFGCGQLWGGYDYPNPAQVGQNVYQRPNVKMPSSIVVCRAKQCAPAKLYMSKEYIYNTLLHMLDSNARQKALVCTGDANTHACTEEFVSLPVTVGVTPAYMYIDDVKITDVSISPENTAALNLILNWGISYNGQIPVCRPSKTLLYAKNVNNVILEDNGYTCKMTTIGTTTVQTMFAIDYIDLDYGYIGGFYSIGLSGPAFGGGSGYMIIRLPNDISIDSKDFAVPATAMSQKAQKTEPKPFSAPTYQAEATPASNVEIDVSDNVPNIDTYIRYNHPAQQYDEAQAKAAKEREMAKEAVDYNGVKVFPVSNIKNTVAPKPIAPQDRNELSDYTSNTKEKLQNNKK